MDLQQKPMTEREEKILKLLQWYRADFYRSSVDERHPEGFRNRFRVLGNTLDEIITKVKAIIEEPNGQVEVRKDKEARDMSKKKEVLGPLALEGAFKCKKVKAPKSKSNDNLGPEQPKLSKPPKTAAAAKPARSKSEASIAVWENPMHRRNIIAGIKRAMAARKAAAPKPKPKAKVPAQAPAQA
jgi:hypothetical protein